MAETKKTYSLVIEGVKESYDAVVKLNDVLEVMDVDINKLSDSQQLLFQSNNETISSINQLSDNIKTISDNLSALSNIEGFDNLKQNFIQLKETIDEISNTEFNFDFIEKLTTSFNSFKGQLEELINTNKVNIDSFNQLNESIKVMDDNINTITNTEKELSKTKKETKTATDELTKAQEKLTSFDAEYQRQLIQTKQELAEKQKAIKDEIAQQAILEGSYYAQQAQLKALGKQIKSTVAVTDEEKKALEELKTQYNSLNDSLKAFDADLGNHQRKVGEYENATRNIKTELREMQEELANMLVNGISPTNEAYLELAQRAGQLQDAIGDARNEIKRFADDTKNINDVIDVAKTATSVFGLYQSTMTAFGIENKEAAEAIAKLQAAMTALNSLQQLQNSLLDNSTATYKLYHKALQLLGIEKKKNVVATTQDTTATVANTTATVASTAATSASTVALKAFKVALASTGIGLIVIALGYLIGNFSEIKNKVVEFLPFLGQLGEAFDKLKAVFMGVGQAVIDWVLTPLRTLAAVAKKLFEGDFKGAIKAGTNEIKKGFNVVENYQKGFDKQQEKNEKNREKERAKKLDKELKDKIDNLNAQYGSDYKFTKEGLELYKQYYANKKKLYKEDSDEYKKAVNEELSFLREVTEHEKKEQDKRNQEAQKAADKRKQDLEKLKEDTKKILEDTTKLYADNEQARLDYQKSKIKELTVANQEQLDYKITQLKEVYDKQETLTQSQYNKELDGVKAQYDKLIKEAERLGQDTSKLKQDYEDRKTAIDEKSKQETLEREQELSKLIVDEQNKLSKLILDQQKKTNEEQLQQSKDNINEINKTLDNQLKNIKTMSTKTTKTGGFFNVVDVDKTKSDISSAIAEYQKLSLAIKEQKQVVSDEYDKQLQLTGIMYGQDSKQYKDLLNQKKIALDKYDSDLKVSLQATSDLQKQEGQVMEEYWDSISQQISEKFQLLNETILTPLYDAFSALNDMALEDAQKNLEKVSKLHDKAVEQVTDSQNKINSLNEQINNANGLRRDELQKVLDDEVKMLAQREIEEERLLNEKAKAEEEVAKKERAQKKMDAAKQIIQGLINTAIAVTGALPNIPLAAIVGAMGAASVAIATAQYSKLEDGGLLKGKSHSQGGIKIPGTNIEVEGQEFVVNKKSTAKYLPLLQAINDEGKSNKSSNITYNNIYKQYADGGQLDYNLLSELASNNIPIAKFDQPYEDNRPVVVSVVDINKGQGRVAKVRDMAGAN